MAILYGTTGDGTTLPVLVDQFGNLLAKGIEGPPGPPGIGQLPPDPFEGAFLGWEDGELSWLGGSVPLPAGTYGPYTYIDGDERLDIPQDASSLVNGQQLYMSDFYGQKISAEFSTDTIANVNGNVLTFPTDNNFDKFEVGDVVQGAWNQSQVWTNKCSTTATIVSDFAGLSSIFDGDPNTYGGILPGTLDITGLDVTGSNLTFKVVAAEGSAWEIKANEVSIATGSGSQDGVNGTISGGTLTAIQLINTSALSTLGTNFATIAVDGNWLVDAGIPNSAAVSITAIDDTVPSITVDGGSWCGADGTGSDQLFVNRSVAGVNRSVAGVPCDTYLRKVMSGSGSVFLGTNGAILLRANNGEWVDDFYVTAPEQRIAARKVASNARRRKKK